MPPLEQKDVHALIDTLESQGYRVTKAPPIERARATVPTVPSVVDAATNLLLGSKATAQISAPGTGSASSSSPVTVSHSLTKPS